MTSASPQPEQRKPAGGGRSVPMSHTTGIVAAFVAVMIGFLVLRNISATNSTTLVATAPVVTTASTVHAIPSTATTAAPAGLSVATSAPPTTIGRVFDGATVVVANASTTNHAAALYSQALQQAGFTMGAATNAIAPEQKLSTSKVYYAAGGQAAAVAATVAHSMGAGVTTAAMPAPPPIKGGDLKGATVLVMLGSDLAGQPLGATPGVNLATGAGGTSTTNAR